MQNSFSRNGENIDFWTAAGVKNYPGPMTQVIHEATHNYQFSQFAYLPFEAGENTAADQSHSFSPWWFSEGQANGIGLSVFIENLQNYLDVRKQTVTRSPGPKAKLPNLTAAGMKTFLTTNQVTGPSNANWPLAYSVGFATVEALIAIGEPESTLALYALAGNGENWDSAFKQVYGITWDEGASILGKVLAAEYQSTPFDN